MYHDFICISSSCVCVPYFFVHLSSGTLNKDQIKRTRRTRMKQSVQGSFIAHMKGLDALVKDL